MDKLSLSAIADEFYTMVDGMEAEPYYKTFHTSAQNDGAAHVEFMNGKFEFVVTERGAELQRVSGLGPDEVLYLLFEGITSSMATNYELRNRKSSGDGRAVWFPYQEELMAKLRPSWGLRLKEKHKQILQAFPFKQ